MTPDNNTTRRHKEEQINVKFYLQDNKDWPEMDGATDRSVFKHKGTCIICFTLTCRPVLWISVFFFGESEYVL